MKFRFHIFLTCLLSCAALPLFAQFDLTRGHRPVIDLSTVSPDLYYPGRFYIKFKPGYNLPASPGKTASGTITFGLPAVDELCQQLGITAANRPFEVILRDEQFDARHKAWGFQLWYTLELSPTADVKRAVKAFQSLAGFIELAEPQYKATLDKIPGGDGSPNPTFEWLPNDPRRSEQWHYDTIKLAQAWDIEKGSNTVTVAVMDEGADTSHPDLRTQFAAGANYGYNFNGNSPTLVAGDHGTHTTGTVGAKNNNAIGVSGVAGGDENPASGVRLMNCQVIGTGTGSIAPAYIWAADRGAAISTNSWGYTGGSVANNTEIDAIDYFIANGGGGIMRNGLVFFSAGNTNIYVNRYPNNYHRVICVAATRKDDVKGGYSNYSEYVDISAPGGANTGGAADILSTCRVVSGSYFQIAGTSMATPHVAGTAALIISRAPGRLSADDVKSLLLTQTDDIAALNPSYINMLGTGRLNAYKALLKTNQVLAQPLVDTARNFTATKNGCNVNLAWTKNNSNQDVLIAESHNFWNLFGVPSGSYNAGDTLLGGGRIIYKGPANGFIYTPTISDSALFYFKIWSVSPANNYSMGRVSFITLPKNISNAAAVGVSTSQINVSWNRDACFSSDVIVASSLSNSFGTPAGTYNTGDAIAGGGVVVYKGTASNFNHTALTENTQYYYKIWPVQSGNTYGLPLEATGRTLCAGAAPVLPITENFNAPDVNSCLWDMTVTRASGNSTPPQLTQVTTSMNASASPAEGGGMLKFNSYDNSYGAIRLSTKAFATNGKSIDVIMRWYHDRTNYVTDSDRVVIQWSPDGIAWNTLQRIDRLQPVTAGNGWYYKQVTLPLAAWMSPQLRIGLLFEGAFGNNCYLDSLSIFNTKIKPTDGVLQKAVSEFTDAGGWTHYNDRNGDRLLSIQKGANTNFGDVLQPAFNVSVGGSSGTVAVAQTPNNYVANAAGWITTSRYYTVKPVTEPAADCPVRFYYGQDDRNALAAAAGTLSPPLTTLNDANIYAYKINDVNGVYNIDPAAGHTNIPKATAYNTNGFTQYVNSGAASTATWLAGNFDAVSFYTEYKVGRFSGGGGLGITRDGGPLPLQWLSFTGKLNGTTAALQWTVTNERQVANYDLQVSRNGIGFENVAKLPASTGQAAVKTYSYNYTLHEKGVHYFRVKQTDTDGGHSYSSQVVLQPDGKTTVLIVPNPVQNWFMVQQGVGLRSIDLLDASGRLVKRMQPPATGRYDVSAIPAGIYFLKIYLPGEILHVRLLKQ